jgi:single-stranded-DNA-specific exonuclease
VVIITLRFARRANYDPEATMTREHRWTLSSPPDDATVTRLAKEINVSENLARVLVNRSIDSYDKAREYFRPSFTYLHDPFVMDGMSDAVDRITQALDRKEKILVFGDYDVDGTNGAAMLYLFFRKMGLPPENVFYHIPDRVKEGYGISQFGIDRGKSLGATVMIAVDCGVTAVEQVEYARSLGIDVIVCDHHEPGDQLPKAHALLDPLKPGDRYPFKKLCGCGVGFKFIQAVARSRGDESAAYEFIDFVTLATAADIVPLVGENRTLVKLGLESINARPRPGLKALIESSGLKFGNLTSGQIVFVLAPRNNAVGRLGDAMRAVELLAAQDDATARKYAQILEEENRTRRKIDEDTFFHAQELVENYLDLENDAAIILHQEHWHPGVIGIVASRLVEKYYRPTIMLTTVNGIAKGSARSIAGFDIHQALKRVEDKLLQFGGHKYAAGLAVAVDRIDEFRDAFNAVVKELLTDDLLVREIVIDAEITLNELSPRFLKILREFAPFGPGNQRPVFLAKDIEVLGAPRIVGNKHLRFKARQDGRVFDAIGFNLGELKERMTQRMDIVFSVDETEGYGFPGNGDPFPQLKVRDLRQAGTMS